MKIVQRPDFIRQFEALALVNSTPEDAQKRIAADYEFWREAVRRAGIEPM